MSDHDELVEGASTSDSGAETMGFPDPSVLAASETGLGLEGSSIGDDLMPRIRGYQVLGILGRGGMGTVWRATQLGTGREVALKLMSARMFASENARRWFEREVRLHARLNHPHIARIYESGLDQGIYFYAMELVDGVPLDRFVRESNLSRRQILELFRLICNAVQYAHELGVIHLDLKPSNILVTQEGQPRVLDFGLAQALGHDAPFLVAPASSGDDAAMPDSPPSFPPPSRTGMVAGTPAYMSPQRVTGTECGNTRSDVYSLGVILYKLMTGESPYDLHGSDVEVMGRIAKGCPIPPRQVNARLDNDIEAIILKSIAKDVHDRYGSPGELARDLGLYLKGCPATARGSGTLYVARKWLTRNRIKWVPALAGSILIAATLAVQHFRFVEEQVEGLRRAQASLAQTLTATAAGLADQGRPGTAAEVYDRAIELMHQSGSATPSELDLIRWSRNQVAPPPLLTLHGHAGGTRAVALFSDQRRAVSGGVDGTVRLWDLPTGRCTLEIAHAGPVHAVAISASQKWILSAGQDGAARCTLIDRQDQTPIVLKQDKHTSAIHSVAWDPIDNGADLPRRALTAHEDGTVILWNVPDATPLKVLAAHRGAATCLSFDAGGKWALTLGRDQKLLRWDLRSDAPGEQMSFFTRNGCEKFAVSAGLPEFGGPLTLTETFGLAFALTSIEKAQHLKGVTDPNYSPACSFAISPDSGEAIVGAEDGNVKLLELRAEPRVVRVYQAHAKPVRAVAFAVNGPYRRLMISGSDDGSIKVWDLGRTTAREARIVKSNGWVVREISFTADGRLAIASGEDGFHKRGSARIIDVATGQVVRTIDQRNGVSGFDSFGTLHIFHPPINEMNGAVSALPFPPTAGPNDPLPTPGVLSKNCKTAICPVPSGLGFHVWDVATGSARGPYGVDGNNRVVCLAQSPDNSGVVTGGSDGAVRSWNLVDGRQRWKVVAHAGNVSAIAISSDGRWALTGGDDGALVRWDLATGRHRQFGYTRGPIASVAIHAGGTLALVAAKADKVGYLWHIPSKEDREAVEMLPLTSEGAVLSCVAFAPNVDRVTAITCDVGSVMRIWDLSRAANFTQQANALGINSPAPLTGYPNLNDLGGWYAARRRSDWAAEVLEQARSQNLSVSPDLLARCYLDTTDRLAHITAPNAKTAEKARAAFPSTTDWYSRYLAEAMGGPTGPAHIVWPKSEKTVDR